MKKIGFSLFTSILCFIALAVPAQSKFENTDHAKRWLVEQLNRHAISFEGRSDFLCTVSSQDLIVSYKVEGKNSVLAFCPWESIQLSLHPEEEIEPTHMVRISSNSAAITVMGQEGNEELSVLPVPLLLAEDQVEGISNAINLINAEHQQPLEATAKP